MSDVVIVEAVRTPVGRRGGELSGVHPAELLGTVLLPLVLEAGAPLRVELPLPDHASLAGRTLQLRVATFDARSRLAWSEERSVTIR